MRSLQAKMFLVFALIATLPLLAMSYLALNETRQALGETVGRANTDAAKAAAGFVDVYVANAEGLLDAEARSPIVRDALASDDRAALLLSARGLQDRAEYQGAPVFQAVYFFDASGELLAVTPPEAASLARDTTHQLAFALAQAQQEIVVVPVPASGPPLLPLATPVLQNGTMRGVVVADASVASLARGLAPFATEGQSIFLADAKGRIILHPDDALLASRPDWSDVPPIAEALAPGAEDAGHVEYDDPAGGERALGAYATIPRLRWVVVDSVPTSQAYAGLVSLTALLVVLSALLVGAILLASVAVARRVVAPVQELTEASHALAAGNLKKRIEPKGDDEIGELGRTFNQMADRIAESLEGLRRSEARYRSLVESANDLIFTVQPDGELSFVGPLARRVLGVASGSPAAEMVHAGDRDSFSIALRGVLQRGEPALWVPIRLHAPGGAERPVLMNLSPVFEGGEKPARVLVVAHDMTEERRQLELREKAFQMARLVSEETALEALAHRGLLLMLGAAGLSRGAVFVARAGAWRELAASPPQSKDAERLAELAGRARTKAEAVREGDALALPLLEHGEVLGAVALAGESRILAQEETDLLNALAAQLAVGLRRSLFEQRLKEHAAELETRVAERTRELTQKSDEMEQFLYSVSHDLKAPLISIQGYSQGLEEDYAHVLTGEGALYLDRIRKNASLMESLILDILELSRIGRVREQVETVDLSKLLGDVQARVQDRFASAGGELVVETPMPPVEGEPRRLSQLFSNLVDNALKYRHPDRPPKVRVWAVPKENEVFVHVQDNGRGIPERYHEQLFKIFQRVPTPGMDDPGGTGMGLAIVKRIAETQGGRVWVDSVENEGTTFHVALPRRRA